MGSSRAGRSAVWSKCSIAIVGVNSSAGAAADAAAADRQACAAAHCTSWDMGSAIILTWFYQRVAKMVIIIRNRFARVG